MNYDEKRKAICEMLDSFEFAAKLLGIDLHRSTTESRVSTLYAYSLPQRFIAIEASNNKLNFISEQVTAENEYARLHHLEDMEEIHKIFCNFFDSYFETCKHLK